MSRRVVIIGSGMAGLTAAIRAARAGCDVTVLEARETAGGLASSIESEGLLFDGGPYILLDRPGLAWAFEQLNLKLEDHIECNRISDVYQLQTNSGADVRVFDSLDETAEQMERQWRGSGTRYRKFITRMQAAYARLQSLQWMSRPSLSAIIKSGAWREIPFMFRSLRSVLRSAKLPDEVTEALGIWTHVAGQTMADAPSPLAMVPSVIHTVGAYYPTGGIGAIPAALFQTANDLNVTFQFDTKVTQINCEGGRVRGVATECGGFHSADAVISNVGVGTYLQLLDEHGRNLIPSRHFRRFARLPLQSPGVCIYMAVKGKTPPPYLRFRLQDQPDGCRLLITPSVVDASVSRDGWSPARLMAPMHHDRAEAGGEAGQRAFLDRVLAESWWRELFEEVRIVKTRIPMEWGSTFRLFRNSMNPVMTGEFMRAGRLAHRCPWVKRLYLTGSATHPGQWVSFCAVSGVLAANELLNDWGS